MGCLVQFPLRTLINAAYPGNQLFTVSSNETVHVEIDGQVHDHEANWFIDNRLTRRVFYRIREPNSGQVEFAINTLEETQKAIVVGGKPLLDLLSKHREVAGPHSDRIFLYDRACEQRFFPPAAPPPEGPTCDGRYGTIALVVGAAVAINFIAMKQSGWF